MSLSSFIELVGPPTAPPIPIDWEAVEEWLGVPLPADYKAFASAYGPVGIGGGIAIHTPCEQDWWDYSSWLRGVHRNTRLVLSAVADPPPIHPAGAGMLVWGESSGGCSLFWDTSVSADADEWPVVLFDPIQVLRGENPWHRLGMMFDFLEAAIATGVEVPGRQPIGPLPPTASRLEHLTGAEPWTAPVVPRRTAAPGARASALLHGSGLETLTTLVAPPDAPFLGGNSLEGVLAALGLRLPNEYWTVMHTYGAGYWKDDLWFPTPDRDAVHAAREMLRTYRELRAEFPEFHPLRVWPEPGGFLPFAYTGEGHQLAWLTEGDPEDWPLILVPHDFDQEGPLPHGLVETLLEWCRGAGPTPGLYAATPHGDPLDEATFVPLDLIRPTRQRDGRGTGTMG